MNRESDDSLFPDAALFPDAEQMAVSGLSEFDANRPHPARIYDVLLGGKDGFEADRRVAAQIAELAPWVISGARGNRAFLRRAVRYLARAGIRQFVDIGSGLPASGNVHAVAQAVDPACRVVYVDHDPIVLTHARALLARDHRTIAVPGDARDPAAILTDPAVTAHLDLDRPVAVLYVAVLHFIGGDQPARIVAETRRHLAPGSYLAVSHAADLPDTAADPDRASATRAAADLYTDTTTPLVLRTYQQVSALFDGFDLLEPGVVPAHLWRPERRPGPPIPVLAAVAHLPTPGPDPRMAPG